jgi:hypothetical protein
MFIAPATIGFLGKRSTRQLRNDLAVREEAEAAGGGETRIVPCRSSRVPLEECMHMHAALGQ